MTNLIQYVDVYVGDEEDAERVLSFRPGNTDVASGELELAGYADILNQMVDKLDFKYIISSLRKDHNASDGGWSTYVMDEKTREFYRSREYRITPIVDRVGGGDSFTAGLVCGPVDGKDMKTALEYTVATSILKHTVPGDSNLMTRADVESLASGDGSDRVQR